MKRTTDMEGYAGRTAFIAGSRAGQVRPSKGVHMKLVKAMEGRCALQR
jgi:hypothetical protein